MADSTGLHLRFILDGDPDISPAEFVALFQCAEDYTRHVAEKESLTLLEDLQIPVEQRLTTMKTLVRKQAPVPAEVVEVRRGSWVVDVLLPSAALIFVLKEYVHPAVKQAWDESRMREQLVSFMRDRVFRGVKGKIEAHAIDKPRFGNLEVIRVDGQEPPQPIVEIRLERRTIIEVRTNDRDLIDDFLSRFRH